MIVPGSDESSQSIEDGAEFLKNPDVAMLYDVDCYTEELKVNDMEVFLDKGYNMAKSVASGITKYLLEV